MQQQILTLNFPTIQSASLICCTVPIQPDSIQNPFSHKRQLKSNCTLGGPGALGKCQIQLHLISPCCIHQHALFGIAEMVTHLRSALVNDCAFPKSHSPKHALKVATKTRYSGALLWKIFHSLDHQLPIIFERGNCKTQENYFKTCHHPGLRCLYYFGLLYVLCFYSCFTLVLVEVLRFWFCNSITVLCLILEMVCVGCLSHAWFWSACRSVQSMYLCVFSGVLLEFVPVSYCFFRVSVSCLFPV